MNLEQMWDDIWEEILDELDSLEGEELDQCLIECGLAPDELLEKYSQSMNAAIKVVK